MAPFFNKCQELDENQQGGYDFKNVKDCEVQIFSILIVILRSSLKIGKEREMFWSKWEQAMRTWNKLFKELLVRFDPTSVQRNLNATKLPLASF